MSIDEDSIDEIVAAHRADVVRAPKHTVAQWHATIDRAANLERGKINEPSRGRRPGFTWIFATAIAATLTLGIAIGILLSPTAVVETPQIAENAKPPLAVPAAFSRGLQYHLRESQTRLASLDTESNASLLILDIIEQNRMFEAAAESNEAHNVARVLRAFEPILLQLAAGDIAPQDADDLREQLSFELNVMLTKLARESSDEAHTT